MSGATSILLEASYNQRRPHLHNNSPTSRSSLGLILSHFNGLHLILLVLSCHTNGTIADPNGGQLPPQPQPPPQLQPPPPAHHGVLASHNGQHVAAAPALIPAPVLAPSAPKQSLGGGLFGLSLPGSLNQLSAVLAPPPPGADEGKSD